MALLELESITKTFVEDGATTPVLHEISFAIEPGEFVAIMGPSGSGKSTLMNIIGLLDVATSGSYLFDGKNVENLSDNEQANVRKTKIGFVFQSFNLLPRQITLDNITLPMVYNNTTKLQRAKRGHDLLEEVGLVDRGFYRPGQLSGGEKQRVAIARALANKPSLILADEPTGNLDTANGKKIMELILKLNKAGNTIIMVTHDHNLASQAHRVIELLDGRVVADSATKTSTNQSKLSDKKPAKKPAKKPKKTKAKKKAKK